MRGNAVCSEMVHAGFANDHFTTFLLLARYNQWPDCVPCLVYGCLKRFLHCKLT